MAPAAVFQFIGATTRKGAIMSRTILLGALGLMLGACNVDVPVDPAAFFSSINRSAGQIGDAIQDAITDPLDAKPFPVLLGGNSARVYYATNLLDIRLNFPGPTNDIVLPSPVGPTHLYELDVARRERTLLQPFVPASAYEFDLLSAVATDGEYIAFIDTQGDGADRRFAVRAGRLGNASTVLFSGNAEGDVFIQTPLMVDAGRVAFVTLNFNRGISRLVVHDLTGADATLALQAHGYGRIALRGTQLAYVEFVDDNTADVLLRDVQTGETTILAEQLHADIYYNEITVLLTGNTAVWTEPVSGGLHRVVAYDIATGQTQLWADAIAGTLTGATDTQFLTQQRIYRENRRDNLAIDLHEPGKQARRLATFSADGQAGQAKIMGANAVWVNPDRQILIAPLAGGDRIRMAPY
jgi:hypothetical protein